MTTRKIDESLFINATPEQVFAAFTEAEHLMRWFAPHARSQPGVGGFINLAWDAGNLNKDCEIVEWEPGTHLLMNWYAGPDGDHCLPVALDLVASGGGTRLRLVHSGFLSDASWDDEFESHARGWRYELRSLKYYLEQCFGLQRQFVMQRFQVAGDLSRAWSALLGEQGVFTFLRDAGEQVQTSSGRLRLPGGVLTAAEVIYELPDRDFAAIAQILDSGLFRFALETVAGQPEIWVWAFSWHLAERELDTLVRPWFDEIAERLLTHSAKIEATGAAAE